VACTSAIGGGSLPGETLPSVAVALSADAPDQLVRRLRLGNPAVIARITDGRVLLDMRTILPAQVQLLITALQRVVDPESGDAHGE
jgi:L-seryl-tRNA(Ser) seleniumtransferase